MTFIFAPQHRKLISMVTVKTASTSIETPTEYSAAYQMTADQERSSSLMERAQNVPSTSMSPTAEKNACKVIAQYQSTWMLMVTAKSAGLTSTKMNPTRPSVDKLTAKTTSMLASMVTTVSKTPVSRGSSSP